MLILYAEDDLDDFDFFCEAVKEINQHASVINARNGLEAIEYLENCVTLPAIIFLDVNMPAMDGKACLRNIKRNDALKGIPVIIYTTSSSTRDRDQCIQLGATTYIQKPSSITEAKEQLRPHVQRR